MKLPKDFLFGEASAAYSINIMAKEISLFTAGGYLEGCHPPAVINNPQKYFEAIHNVIVSHSKCVRNYDEGQELYKMGMVNSS